MSGDPDPMSSAPDRLDRPSADSLADALFPRVALGTRWELDRTRRALRTLGDPHLEFASLHVGGTNGKGSVAAMLDSVLRSAGHRVGLYTSPQLCGFQERFIVDGAPLAETVLRSGGDPVRRVVEEEGLTFFEAATVLAFLLFAEAGVKVAVVEVGLGGRLDATNVLTPAVSIVTNVALDHAEYLGRDLTDIAREKAGIIKAGVPVVVGERDPELLDVFRREAANRGAPFHPIDPERDVRLLDVRRDHTAFVARTDRWGELRLRTGLVGEHQAANGAVAIAALECLPSHLRPNPEAVIEGVRSVRWPGRNQVEIIDGRTWLFDVAHNAAGVGTLIDTLERIDLPRPWVGLIGIAKDKDWRSMLPPLLSRCASAWLTRPALGPLERRWDPAEVAEALELADDASKRASVRVEPDLDRALIGARMDAGEGTVVVTGSVYTVGSALLSLERPPFGAPTP